MAEGKIGFSDAFDGNFPKQLQELNTEFKKFLKTYQALIKESKDNKELIQAAKSLTEFNKAAKKAADTTKKLTDVEKEQARILKATAAATVQAQQATTKEGVALAKAREEKRRATLEAKKLAKAQLEGVKSTNRWTTALGSFQFKFNALGNLMAQAASTVFRAFIRVVKQGVEVVKNFDSTTARLASVTGKTRDEIADLTDQAKELGATTQFTASQVTGLQIELAKLGFVADEIKDATPAILSFATATGADLAAAAKTAGVAVRAFGLDASETEDAVATLAVATTKSALSFSDYETILSTLGPVAKAYGFTLSETVALTGKLRDAGFDATKAATATRNILLNLADANGALAKSLGGSVSSFDELIDGLVELDERGVSLAETLELTDKRSVAAFNQFLTTAEGARDLEGAITGVNDELKDMVDVQLDTLAGDLDLLRSAWEGLIIAMSDGGVLREAVQLLTNAVLQVSNLDLAVRKFNKQSAEQLARSFDLLVSLSNRQGEQFKSVIEQYSDASVGVLEASKDQIIDQLSDIRKVNKKEAAALYEELLERRKESIAKEIEAEEVKAARIASDEAAQAKKRVSTLEDVSDQIKAIKADESKALIEADQEYVAEHFRAWDNIAAASEGGLEQIQAILNQQMADEMERQEKLTAIQDAAREERIRKEQETENTIASIKRQAINYAANIGTSYFNLQIAQLDAELDAASDNAEEQEKIEKRQAQQRKDIALKQTYINIASGIARAFADYAWPYALIPAAAVGIEGGLQIAAINAQQFAKGTDSSPEGPAWVGEKGPELKITPKGKVSLTPGKPTLDYLEKGTQIVPADITNQMLRYATVANAFEGKGDDKSILMMMDELQGLRRDLRHKPVASSTMTPAGIRTAIHKGNTTINKVKRYSS